MGMKIWKKCIALVLGDSLHYKYPVWTVWEQYTVKFLVVFSTACRWDKGVFVYCVLMPAKCLCW
jgi:hypothetical protein